MKFRIHLRVDDFRRDDVRNNIFHVRGHNENGRVLHHGHDRGDGDVPRVHDGDHVLLRDDVRGVLRVHFQNLK